MDDVAQSVEHVTVNHAVAGSNPAIVGFFRDFSYKNLKQSWPSGLRRKA